MTKLKTFIGLAILSLAFILVGCTTTPTGESVPDTARIARISAEATELCVTELLDIHPEWIVHFQIAHQELSALEKADNVSVDSLLEIIRRLPVKELQSRNARLAFSGAKLLISSIDIPELDASKLEQIRPIVTAIREALERAGVNGPQ